MIEGLMTGFRPPCPMLPAPCSMLLAPCLFLHNILVINETNKNSLYQVETEKDIFV